MNSIKPLFKKYYWVLPIILLGGLFFVDSAFAQQATVAGTTPSVATQGSSTASLSDAMFNTLGSILNILYIIALPVLIIAGKAMDNSMIYGEFMNLDRALYMLWNLSRTFANFAIGWVLLWKIFMYIFKDWWGNAPAILKDIIIKWIMIVLGVNLSWFAIGALIDLSTIATYSLGSMPLWAIKEVNKSNDMPILSIMSFFDYQSDAAIATAWQPKVIKPYMYYKRGNINIPQCAKLQYGIVTWPEYYPTIPNKPEVSFTGREMPWTPGTQYCALNPQTLANISSLEKRKSDVFTTVLSSPNNNDEKNTLMKNTIEKLSTSTNCNTAMTITGTNWLTTTIEATKIMELSDILQFGDGEKPSYTFCNGQTAANTLTVSKNVYSDTARQASLLSWWIAPYSSQSSHTMNTLMDQSQGMVWPFVTLYMTLLNFSNLSNIDQEDVSVENQIWWFTEFLLKSAISVAVFIPLVALAGVLIIRVILLWAIIAFIPLGIVFFGLKDELKDAWLGSGLKAPSFLWGKDIDWKAIIWLIFAPVLPVFTICISLIVLQTLQMELSKSINSDNKAREFFGMKSNVSQSDPNMSCIDFWGMQEVCYKSDPQTKSGSGFANLIPWLFINIFGIGLMWMMVKVSLSSSSIAWWIWWKIMDLWGKALGAIPIPGLSIWWVWISANTLWKAPTMIERSINTKLWQDQYKEFEAIERLFGKKDPSKEGEKWFAITKNAEVKKWFITQAPQVQNKTTAVKDRINHFEKVLQTHDEQAYKSYTALSNPADKAQELMNYINTLSEEERKDLDTDKLLENILTDKIDKIKKEPDSSKNSVLKESLKQYIKDKNINIDTLFTNNRTTGNTAYAEIIKTISDIQKEVTTPPPTATP